MPQTGDHTMSGFSSRWLSRRKLSLIASCGIISTVLLLAACAGVNDNGTTFETLATMEARQAPPPAPTSDPGGAPPDTAALVEIGRQIYTSSGCIGCHTVDGSASVGPTWAGLWMADIPLEDGTTVVGDELYIHTSIIDPGAQIHRGFPNIMPSYEGQLNDDQINGVIEYIKTLE